MVNAMTEKATFAAGCFWGIEASFREVKGVINATVGYSGGRTATPTYEEVCTDRTGHAESVLVEFDPSVVSYDQLLESFWSMHNPTTKDRQGPDVGTQYRSAIFYHTPEQRDKAMASKAKQERSERYGGRPIVTEIVPASTFYPAEEYHQRYHEKHGLRSCRIC
jgi:peptide-methionine (S)-S-oxide reductase